MAKNKYIAIATSKQACRYKGDPITFASLLYSNSEGFHSMFNIAEIKGGIWQFTRSYATDYGNDFLQFQQDIIDFLQKLDDQSLNEIEVWAIRQANKQNIRQIMMHLLDLHINAQPELFPLE